MRVFVLGHRGMLGHVVARRLAESGHEVETSDARYDGTVGSALVRAVTQSTCEAVVNAAGRLREGSAAGEGLLVANGLLPQHLAASLGPGRLLVHASSDGVFGGTRGAYDVVDPPDAADPYGVSKQLGELARFLGRVVVLRCSIVGPEQGTARGLLAWFLSQSGPVLGYDNWRWNGITTLAWADLCLRALSGDVAPGVHQPGCNAVVSKYELLRSFGTAFGKACEVNRASKAEARDYSLRPTLDCGRIEVQLADLRQWYGA